MGNTMGKKRKVGSSSTKWLAPETTIKKDGLSPLGRSYSMPVHHGKQKSDNYHVVALTSSTYGILKVDLGKEGEEGRTSMSRNRALGASDENFQDKLRFDIPEAMVDQPWSEVTQVMSKLKPVKDGRVKALDTLRSVDEELLEEPETINMWELMEGLDEDARSPLPPYASQVGVEPSVTKKVRSLEASLSFSACHTITEVDADILEDALKAELRAAVDSDTLVKGKFYSQSPSAVRTSPSNAPHRHGSGKENATTAPSVHRESAPSTLTPAKLNYSVNVSSPAPVASKGNSSVKVNSMSNTPGKAGGVVDSVSEYKTPVRSGVVSSVTEYKAPARTGGGNELPFAKAKSKFNSSPLSNSVHSVPRTDSPQAMLKTSAPSPLTVPRSKSENAPGPYGLTSPSDVSEGHVPPESPLFDPELLASFEKAMEDLSEDDWYRVRRSDAGVASTSGSSSDGDSPLRVATNNTVLETSPLARKPETDANSRKISFSKVAPVDFRDVVLQKVVRKVDPFKGFEMKCPPGGEDRVVLYVTSLRGIRKTFEDCSHMKLVILGYRVAVDERDVAMHADFRQELKDLLGKPMPVPRLFIKGRYIGGADEVSLLHEDGTLARLLATMPTQTSWEQCDGCGDHRFVPCSECSGSCKVLTEDDEVVRCTECNENGLIRCPICF